MNTKNYTTFVLANYFTKFEPAIAYLALGIGGESGEVVDAVKKRLRGDDISDETIVLELGNVLYYIVRLAHELGWTIEEVMAMNVDKLEHRKKYGKEGKPVTVG